MEKTPPSGGVFFGPARRVAWRGWRKASTEPGAAAAAATAARGRPPNGDRIGGLTGGRIGSLRPRVETASRNHASRSRVETAQAGSSYR
ncbi:hypothetical protein GLE_2748 [Lysobacter enzymogenes]|uniref:Uncharacterized protein n=1 Tax=Lysobacter enzymogenes TaxID=69 RepID=A0A0S2DI36_LYSEN|nr:hypothetical protein GLE_2748 [Lysobacter enzymogenes]